MQLIERSELDVIEISLSDVTEQYLGYIGQLEDLDPEEINWFLGLAARLLHIKSQALIPGIKEEESDNDVEELKQQLERYRHYQKAAEYLRELLSRGSSWERPVKPTVDPKDLPLPRLDLAQLERAFADCLDRLEDKPAEAVLEKVPSLDEMIERVELYRLHGEGNLSQLVAQCRSRLEAVVLFMAVLELVRTGRIQVHQSDQFGDMILVNEP
jgi:segregation and condensation protein A